MYVYIYIYILHDIIHLCYLNRISAPHITCTPQGALFPGRNGPHATLQHDGIAPASGGRRRPVSPPTGHRNV